MQAIEKKKNMRKKTKQKHLYLTQYFCVQLLRKTKDI